MTVSVTQNDLLLYLYNESGPAESVAVQKAIDHDQEIAEEFAELVTVKTLIDQTMLSASESSIASVLAYAAITAPLQR